MQAIDLVIYQLKKEKEEKPLRITELQNEFEAKKINLKAIEDELKGLQVKMKESELDLASKEENIEKVQTQLYQLKTNKEYQAMLVEIGGFQADKSIVEENILKMLDSIDESKIKIEDEKTNLAQEERYFNEQKKEVEDRIKEIDQELHQLEARRMQGVDKLDKKILSQYERILHNRNGLAMVSVKDDSCQGCFMNVPPQVINEIKMKNKIIICEVCSRILYIEGEF